MVDLTEPVKVYCGEEFVIPIGFKLNPAANSKKQSYAVDHEQPPELKKTFRASFSDYSGWSEWTDYTEIHENSAFFLQGIMLD